MEENLALDGGAIYSGGVLEVYDSKFKENFAEDSGGALFVDAYSSTVLKRNQFFNNIATEFGPAVSNHYNTFIEMTDNEACENVFEKAN